MENTCRELRITLGMSDIEILEILAQSAPLDLDRLREIDSYAEVNSIEDVIRITREAMHKNDSIEESGIYHEFGIQLIRFAALFDSLPDAINVRKLHPIEFEKARKAFEFYERLRALVKIAKILNPGE